MAAAWRQIALALARRNGSGVKSNRNISEMKSVIKASAK
jgi:hypothetical protein